MLLVSLCFLSLNMFSHTINYENQVLRHWFIQKDNKYIDGSFYMFKNGKVYIEDAQNSVLSYPMAALSKPDQAFALQKEQKVEVLNNDSSYPKNEVSNHFNINYSVFKHVERTINIFVIFLDKPMSQYLVFVVDGM